MKLAVAVALIAVAGAFQNCGSSSFKQIDQTLQKLGGFGNGQGYPGKLSGVYASLDTTNTCGLNSTISVAVKDRVQIINDRIFKITENCQPLLAPQEISLNQVNAVGSQNQVLVINDRLFQTGSWVESSAALNGTYTDLYCTGYNVNNRVEVAIVGGLFSRSRPDDHDQLESALNINGTVHTTRSSGQTNTYVYNDFEQDWHGDDSLEVRAGDRVRIRFDSFRLPGPFTPTRFEVELPSLEVDSFQTSSCWVPF